MSPLMHSEMHRLGERLGTQRARERPLSGVRPHVFTEFERPCAAFATFGADMPGAGGVHLSLVFPQNAGLLEPPAAHGTGVRPLGAVRHLMPLQRCHRAERHPALLTAGRLLAAVRGAVLLHLTLVEKRFAARVTREPRRHRAMLLQVRHERRPAAEALPARVTLEGPLPGVESGVHAECGGLSEGARAVVAAVRPLVGVGPEVGSQLGRAGESAGADGADGGRRGLLVLPPVMLQAGRVTEHLAQRRCHFRTSARHRYHIALKF